MSMIEAQQAVERGAKLFDKMFTRTDEHGRTDMEMWGNYIDRDTLDMASWRFCVAAQLSPILASTSGVYPEQCFSGALRSIENKLGVPEVPESFSAKYDKDFWFCYYGLDNTAEYSYEELQDAWLIALESRTDDED